MSKLQAQISIYEMPMDHNNVVDIEHWFAPLSHQPWAVLLQSSGSNNDDSQFDIITADPVATITAKDKNCVICHYENSLVAASIEKSAAPIELAEQLQTELFGHKDLWPNSELPFIGGAMGFLSYDLGRSLESMPAIAEEDIQLPHLAIGFYDWALLFNKQKQKLYLVQHGNNDALHKRLNWLKRQDAPCSTEPFKLTSPWQSNMTQAGYVKRFDKVQAYLQSGDCYQINLAQRFSASYKGCEWQAYQKLSKANKAPFSAFMRHSDSAILSLSPERFMQVTQNEQTGMSHVQTKPIKGTRPRMTGEKSDQLQIQSLKTASKDRAENLMIVDLLRNDLSRVCQPGSVVVPQLFAIESFAAVHHMISTIEGQLQKGKTAWDLLTASFPGGSITGAPKIRAMEVIEELEPHRRSIYCGSIFYIGANGTMDSSISIRTLVTEHHKLYCWGGGGLVADSQALSEYQETLDKLSKILPLLSPSNHD